MADPEPSAQQRQDMLLPHIILPRCPPQNLSPYLHTTELQLVHKLIETVTELSVNIPEHTVKLFKSLRKIHDGPSPDTDTISSEINALRPGDSFAIFVRRQRWMFMIHVPRNGNENAANRTPHEVIIATFPGNVRPSEIYKHESDIEVI